jgi:hypothetical protein
LEGLSFCGKAKWRKDEVSRGGRQRGMMDDRRGRRRKTKSKCESFGVRGVCGSLGGGAKGRGRKDVIEIGKSASLQKKQKLTAKQ